MTVIHGDCVEAMASMAEESIDAVVCDPPYLLNFMGKKFDSQDGAHLIPAQQQAWHEAWAREALRVLRPGGHCLAFGGTRTYHRLAAGLEDAGFEIRDCLSWNYGSGLSGFPKSLDVSKAIDKAAGVERVVVGMGAAECEYLARGEACPGHGDTNGRYGETIHAPVTLPATDAARQWDGWGTALKPAWEPVVVARKPLAGTVAGNVQAHGTGALNIDACRIGTEERENPAAGNKPGGASLNMSAYGMTATATATTGRWPANVLLAHAEDCVQVGTRTVKGDPRETGGGTRPGGFVGTGAPTGDGSPNAAVYGDAEVVAWDCVDSCPVAMLDAQTGTLTSGRLQTHHKRSGGSQLGTFDIRDRTGEECDFGGDSGGASRFFYVAKASRAERNAGLAGFEMAPSGGMAARHDGSLDGHITMSRNPHPTVKPIAVMRWLVRLVTPPGGRVLDPFLGSGTTGIAALLEGFDWVGCEQDETYAAIAEARVAFWIEHGEDGLRIVAERDAIERRGQERRQAHVEAGQLDLFGEAV